LQTESGAVDTQSKHPRKTSSEYIKSRPDAGVDSNTVTIESNAVNLMFMASSRDQTSNIDGHSVVKIYSTVTDLAKFLG
jgi:hypothetical protein